MKDEATEGADDHAESAGPGEAPAEAEVGLSAAGQESPAEPKLAEIQAPTGQSEAAEADADADADADAGSDGPTKEPPPQELNEGSVESERAESAESAERKKNGLMKWAFLAIPVVALLELAAHVAQTHDVVPESDWSAARSVVEKKITADDLLLFAPKWQDPVGRATFGDKLASLERTARPDESRFARAIEVSSRGKHRPELEGWKLLEEERVGRLVVGTYENPHPAKVLDDLRLRVSPEKMAVFRVEAGVETPCPFVRGRTQAGGLGAGPAIPGDRFQCDGGSFVGASIIHALDHDPRACLFAPPFGPTTVLRVRFRGVRFGAALHGHHGLQNEAERDKAGAPVNIAFRTDQGLVGRVEHKDGMGWTGFELQTQELSGKTLDLTADITAGNANRRHYCFEADTR